MLEQSINHIAQALKNEPVAIFFSTGKDSIAMADLFFKYYPGEKSLFFMYFVDGLEIKESILRHYEKRWNIKINRIPCEENLAMKTGKKVKLHDIEHGVRFKYDITWIAQGVRKDESLARRGMLANLPYGIDERNHKLYPIAEWSSKQVMSYCKFNKLPLPIEYQHGLNHDWYIPDAKLLLYLKNNFYNDYMKVIQEFPHLEAAIWREEHAS